MKVILKQDVRHLGRSGDLVNVANGYARNFLFPRNLAAEATESRVKEFEHWKRVSDSRKKKAFESNKDVIESIKKVNLTFKLAAGVTDKLFGSVSAKDIAEELSKLGYSVEKKEVLLTEPIKVLGSHKVTVSFGEGLDAEIPVSVERKDGDVVAAAADEPAETPAEDNQAEAPATEEATEA